MFTKSIRWRLQLWLAFLLVCVLSGFGVTVYQLQRINQLNQLDEELERRVAALSSAVRGGPPPDHGPGHSPFDGPRDSPGFGFDDGWRPPPPPRGRPEPPPDGARGRTNATRNTEHAPDGLRGMRTGPRADFRLAPEAASLFDEGRTNAFYFAVWSRDGTL